MSTPRDFSVRTRFTLIELLVANRRYRAGDFSVRTRFTLIELLVVIAIIAVLAAMLLPSLNKARESAKRALCLADRKENGVSLALYVDDHDGVTPSATGMSDSPDLPGLTPSPWTHWHPSGAGTEATNQRFPQGSQTHEGVSATSIVYALGTLARSGYVGDPRQMFCNTYSRGSGIQNELDINPYAWKYVTDGDLAMHHGAYANAFRYNLGITHHFFGSDGGTYRSPARRLVEIADIWDKNNQISPLMITCRQGNGFGGGNANGSAAVAAGRALSHKGKGSNGVFYDGSARWISQQEVMSYGWQTNTNLQTGYNYRESFGAVWMFTDASGIKSGGAAGNFIVWSRRHLKP